MRATARPSQTRRPSTSPGWRATSPSSGTAPRRTSSRDRSWTSRQATRRNGTPTEDSNLDKVNETIKGTYLTDHLQPRRRNAARRRDQGRRLGRLRPDLRLRQRLHPPGATGPDGPCLVDRARAIRLRGRCPALLRRRHLDKPGRASRLRQPGHEGDLRREVLGLVRRCGQLPVGRPLSNKWVAKVEIFPAPSTDWTLVLNGSIRRDITKSYFEAGLSWSGHRASLHRREWWRLGRHAPLAARRLRRRRQRAHGRLVQQHPCESRLHGPRDRGRRLLQDLHEPGDRRELELHRREHPGRLGPARPDQRQERLAAQAHRHERDRRKVGRKHHRDPARGRADHGPDAHGDRHTATPTPSRPGP